MRHPELVHAVELLPRLRLNVEQVDFSIPVGVLAADQDYLGRRDGQGRACPQGVLHSNCEHRPDVLLDFIHLDGVVYLLLGASEETSEGVDELVVERAGAEVVPLVLHRAHDHPLVFPQIVFLHRVESLLAGEPAENEYLAFAHGDGMSVPALVHRGFVYDVVFQGVVHSGVFLGGSSTASDQDLARVQSDGS